MCSPTRRSWGTATQQLRHLDAEALTTAQTTCCATRLKLDAAWPAALGVQSPRLGSIAECSTMGVRPRGVSPQLLDVDELGSFLVSVYIDR